MLSLEHTNQKLTGSVKRINFVQSFLYGTNEIDNVGAIKNFVFTAKLIDHNEMFII